MKAAGARGVLAYPSYPPPQAAKRAIRENQIALAYGKAGGAGGLALLPEREVSSHTLPIPRRRRTLLANDSKARKESRMPGLGGHQASKAPAPQLATRALLPPDIQANEVEGH